MNENQKGNMHEILDNGTNRLYFQDINILNTIRNRT